MFDPFAPFRLTGRTALVTGARREIGRAIALGLAGAGARLAIHHAGTSEERSDAADVVREIQGMGGEATAFGQEFSACGVADPKQPQAEHDAESKHEAPHFERRCMAWESGGCKIWQYWRERRRHHAGLRQF